MARHHVINDSVACAFASAGLPVSKEPHGLIRSDGKRPAGLTMVPWKEGKPLTWDVTTVCPTAEAYVEASDMDEFRVLTFFTLIFPSPGNSYRGFK